MPFGLDWARGPASFGKPSMPETLFSDEWLAHSLQGVLTAERLPPPPPQGPPLRAAPSRIADKPDELYRPEKAIDNILQGMQSSAELVQIKQEAEELVVSEEEASQRPVVRLVDLIISEGILSRSSDIHIEPEEGGVAVRYRIDGVLRQVMKIPRAAGLTLISR